MNTRTRQALTLLLGAAAGGVAGYFLFVWIARNYGGYGFAIPGVGVALGAGFFRCPSKWLAVVVGFIGLIAGIFSAWRILPFAADQSLGYFLRHLLDFPGFHLTLILIGAVVAFWIPFRRVPKFAE